MTLLLKVRQNGWLMRKKRWTELGKAEKIVT